ncbi:MAG TPA: NfeD family protein [Solirubrobacteraceae bacterium]|nr:NfeD family protein [Solirubrobacteraceae bacterium]
MTALGIALLCSALLLLLAEAHVSTGGLIAATGSVAAVGGIAVLLIAAGAGAVVVLIAAACVAALAFSALMLLRRRILRPLRARPRTGREALVGHIGVVRSIDEAAAQVYIDGSLWRAEPDQIRQDTELHDGDHVVVEHVNGLTLHVRRAEAWELNP